MNSLKSLSQAMDTSYHLLIVVEDNLIYDGRKNYDIHVVATNP